MIRRFQPGNTHNINIKYEKEKRKQFCPSPKSFPSSRLKTPALSLTEKIDGDCFGRSSKGVFSENSEERNAAAPTSFKMPPRPPPIVQSLWHPAEISGMGATHESEEGDRAAANRTEQRRNEVLIAELIYSLLLLLPLRGQVRGRPTTGRGRSEGDNLAAAHSSCNRLYPVFSCGEARNSSRAKCSFFFFPPFGPKKAKTVQTNIVAYVVWAIDFKSNVRCDLRGCLEVVLASKPHFLCWSPIDGSS